MKYTSTILGALCVTTVVAAPGTAARWARNAEKRASGLRHGSKPNQLIQANATSYGPEGAQTSVSTSGNWAGAVCEGSGWKTVTGTFTVPTPKEPSGGNSGTAYSASAWVGIDGDECQSAILQTGVDFTVQDGQVSYDCWYEWYPDYAYDFSGISFNPGDQVQTTVVATGTNSGTATIKNLSSGKTVSHTFTNQNEGSLCQTDAEWIVEDYEEGNGQVAFANFGSVTFSNAYAAPASGSKTYPSSCGLIDMVNSNGQHMADASFSGNNVVVKYG